MNRIILHALRTLAALILTLITYFVRMYTFFMTTSESTFKVDFKIVLLFAVYWLALYGLERIFGRKSVPIKSVLIATAIHIIFLIGVVVISIATDIKPIYKAELSIFAIISYFFIYILWNLAFERKTNDETKKNDPVSHTE